MRTLGLLYLWFAATGLALGAISTGSSEPLLTATFAAGSALCIWTALEKSPRAILALCGLPWILGVGMLSIASAPDRRNAIAAIIMGGVLWSGTCIGVAMRVRRRQAAAP